MPIQDQMTQENEQADTSRGYIVVVKEGANSLGVVIDELIAQEEAVVKPVTDMFDYNEAISGATIMGDGSVHMILDIPFLIKQSSRKGV